MKNLLTLLPIALLTVACSEPPRAAQPAESKPPVPVSTLAVDLQDIPSVYSATGVVHARTESQLASQMMARVRAVNVQAGDRVHAGQVLVSLDSAEPDAAYHRAEAGRAESQSAIAESDSNIAQAKANLDLANVTAQRMQDLFSKRSISQQEMDETNAKLKTAQASYEMARARRDELDGRIAQTDAGLAEAQTGRGYALIRAPFNGIVTARNIEPGAIAVPGAPLLTVEAGNGYRMHAAIEESQLSNIHLNAQVNVFIDTLQTEIPGRIVEISPVSDANSHSYTVKIDLPSNPAIHAGEFGHISFVTGQKQGFSVPASAVHENGQLQSVFVADHGVARIRLVTLGEKQNDQFNVLSGLDKGDRVINPVPSGLADGDRVEER